MNMIRFKPWSLADLFDDQPSASTSQWLPLVDIKEEADKYIVLADVPGVDPKNIEISTENNILTIKGERAEETQEEKLGFTRKERVRGSFYRHFTLPEAANSDGIRAKSKDGVLQVTIPKQEKTQAKRINVAVE